MNRLTWLLLAPLFFLSVASQTPPPATGPTMQQTVDFINDAFTKQGPFDIEGGDVKSGQYKGTIVSITKKFREQRLTLDSPCQITFSASITRVKVGRKFNYSDEKPMPNVESDGSEKQVLRLDQADPLQTAVLQLDSQDRDADAWPIGYGKDTLYYISAHQVSRVEDPKNNVNSAAAVGYFVDKDRADRVARAYLHAIVLCQKQAAPSLF